jgi:lysine-N-methylase
MFYEKMKNINETIDVVQPEYIKEFACIGGACPDSCCANWNIVFDEDACRRYENCTDAAIHSCYQMAVQRNVEMAADGTVPYAFVQMTAAQRCPFLLQDGFCLIQRHTEEQNLSETCRTYPRVWHTWGFAYAECSMDVSCPRAAQLILQRQAPLHFLTEKCSAQVLAGYRREDPESELNLWSLQLRNFLIFILQQPVYTIEERLLLANRFFWEAAAPENKLPDKKNALVDRYVELLSDSGQVRELLSHGSAQRVMQLDVLRLLLCHRRQMSGPPVGADFSAAADRVMQRWQLKPDAPVTAESVRAYTMDLAVWRDFIIGYPYMEENYLVNQVFKIVRFTDQPANADGWIQLIFQFALLRLLLMAAIGEAGASFTEAAAVSLIQKTARTVEHNRLYLQQAVKLFAILQMEQSDGMETLIR